MRNSRQFLLLCLSLIAKRQAIINSKASLEAKQDADRGSTLVTQLGSFYFSGLELAAVDQPKTS